MRQNNVDTIDTILALAGIGAAPAQPSVLVIDGVATPIEEVSLGGAYVATERPGEPQVALEIENWPILIGPREAVALATRQLDLVGGVTLATTEVDGVQTIVAVDVGGVYADGIGGHWDVGTLEIADPEDVVATAGLPLAA